MSGRVLGRRGELVGQPLLLNRVDRAVLGDVRVHADECREWRKQCPIGIRKIQAHARRILRDGIDVGIGLHEVGDPSVQRGLQGRIVHFPVVIARNRKNRRGIALIRLVELRVVVVVRAGEVHHVANVIAELRRIRAIGAAQGIDHSVGDVGLKFAVLNAAGVAQYMEDHLVGRADMLRDILKMVAQSVVVRRKAEWLRQRLIACVSMREGIERTHTGMRLRMALFNVGTN